MIIAIILAGGSGSRIVGNPSAGTLLSGAVTDPWKKTGKPLKRVIWAGRTP